jgi:preprotein translocase subunit SecA
MRNRADFLLRGLQYAIVDEADSVLIDEAKTPLIIARCTDNTAEQTTYGQALHMARQLVEGRDFVVDRGERTVRIHAVRRGACEGTCRRPWRIMARASSS